MSSILCHNIIISSERKWGTLNINQQEVVAEFIPCRYFNKLQWKHFPKKGKGSLAGPQQHLFVSSGIAINLCEAKQCKPLAMCMLLNWIKKFQLPLNGPNLPSSSPFGLHGTSGRTGVFVLVIFACPCNIKLLENAMQKCNQPNESTIIHGWWLAGIKHMAATIKARNSRDGCCSPFTRWCFASYDPRIFVNLKSSKQVKWAVYRQESKAEQSRRKSFVWDLFLHNLSFDTPVSHILFLP